MTDGRRILLIEDNAAIRSLLSELLAGEGYETRMAAGGREGLKVLGEWRPDLILLDLSLPDIDAQTFRIAQRKLASAAEVPLVVVSAATNAQDQADQLAAAEELAKPFDVDQVLTTVARLTK
jgi:two-component system, OmpR family, alkaline phosphatase synthesis response regulator PhoP